MSRYVFVKINDDITSIKRLKEMFPKIDEEDFEDILESDPTYANGDIEAGKYGRWLLSLFNKNNLKKEDLYKAKEYLEKFEKKKAKFSNKDINAYKNLPDLYKAIEEVENKEPTKSELKRNVQRTDLDKDAELYMETENFKIYVPLTYEASCKLGNNTQWCTATRSDRKYYDMYTEDNNKLYIFINKKDPSEKYQWNTLERYTCDRNDEEISETMLCMLYPDLIKFFDEFGYNIENLIKEIKEYKDGKEYIYNGERIDKNLAPRIQKAKISKDITEIGDHAFYNCSALKSIEIPNSVLRIAKYAFSGCDALTNITIPNGLISIGDGAFFECSSLKSIEIPNGITIINPWTFFGCKSLKNIELPDSITSIKNTAFSGCISLTNIKIPNGVISIEDRGFGACRSLTNITIPDSVGNIGKEAFSNCSSLENIEIPNSVGYIGSKAFKGCSPDLVIKTKNPYVIEYCKQYGLRYSEE